LYKFVNYFNFTCANSSCILLVNLSTYVSQGLGRLRHHHETFWNTPDYVAETSR